MPRDKATGRWLPGESGNPERQLKSGHSHLWQTGQSGNPAGQPRARVDFERAFNEALVTAGSPEEAAQLLWEAARAGEAWAIQNLCQRFAPQTQSLRLLHEIGHNDEIDYTKLTDEQIEQLDAILETAGLQPSAVESGESPPQST